MTGLDSNGLPQSAEPAVEANYVFAFVGEAERPDEWSESDEEKEQTDVEENNGLGEWNADEDQMIGSMDRAQRSMISIDQAKRWKLLPGERLGWWSSRKFDRRVRMQALVMGAVNDERTKILLDTRANVSAGTEAFAKKLRLKRLTNDDMKIDVQGIAKSKVATTSRAIVKVTLGWEVVYQFEVWIMPHHAGVDLILGTDFMIPACIRLDLYNSMAKLPDEVVVPLIKSSRDSDDTEYGREVIGGPRETLDIMGREIAQFKLRRKQPSVSTHELWVRQLKRVIPTVQHNAAGRAVRVLLTNLTTKLTWCPAHFPVVLWMPHGVLPRDEGYVRVNSAKYRDWQVLAYEGALDNRLLKKEQRLYMEWLSQQPPAVKRQQYKTPAAIKTRPIQPEEDDVREPLEVNTLNEKSTGVSNSVSAEVPITEAPPGDSPKIGDSPNSAMSLNDFLIVTAKSEEGARQKSPSDQRDSAITAVHSEGQQKRCSTKMDRGDQRDPGERNPIQHRPRPGRPGLVECAELDVSDTPLSPDPAEDLRLRFLTAVEELEMHISTTAVILDDGSELVEVEHSSSDESLTDYAHELAFLPDLTEAFSTELGYEGDNVLSPAHDIHQRQKLIETLKRHERIMISSGNALPPPAYGVVCDIDVQGHDPIKQRARRVPLKNLSKLYELLKALLKAGLVSFSKSPWASPIVIVMKKNGIDIRLCIDYKLVNAITVSMEYAMPLVDDLLTEQESYL